MRYIAVDRRGSYLWVTFSRPDKLNVLHAEDLPGLRDIIVSLGPGVTGLVFTGAAMDNFLRAFDSETGKELWNYELPAGGQATPMTYIFRGKQYVVIAAGGHGKLGTKQGDSVVAFALP